MDRDEALRTLGVDPEAFKVYMKQSQVDNECGTDEYRETQPEKGLHMIAEVLEDSLIQGDRFYDLVDLTAKWLTTFAAERTSYGGADELAAALEVVFEYRWTMGYYSLYQGAIDYLDDLPAEVEWYKEERGEQ